MPSSFGAFSRDGRASRSRATKQSAARPSGEGASGGRGSSSERGTECHPNHEGATGVFRNRPASDQVHCDLGAECHTCTHNRADAPRAEAVGIIEGYGVVSRICVVIDPARQPNGILGQRGPYTLKDNPLRYLPALERLVAGRLSACHRTPNTLTP